MDELKQSHEVEIKWHSYQLRPSGTKIPESKIAQINAGDGAMKDRIRKQMGLEFNRGPLQVDSLPSLILAKYAESQGKGEVFNKAMMAAYFLEAQAIDNPEVLRQVLNKVGLPGEQLEEILENQIYRGEVEADIRQAREFDLNGVPALVFEEKYLVSGAQPYDVLRQVVEKVKEEIGE